MSQYDAVIERDIGPSAGTVDRKLEVVVTPLSDVDRVKRFYCNLGWKLDADFVVNDRFRVVQFTPPGSPASIHFGKGIASAEPDSASGLFLIVSDIEAARAMRVGRDVDASEVSPVPWACALCAPTSLQARQDRSRSSAKLLQTMLFDGRRRPR